MESNEILKFCLERGLLIDKEVLNSLNDTFDLETSKKLINKIKTYTNKRFITKTVLSENQDKIHKIFSELEEVDNKRVETLKIKLGLSIEISKEVVSSKENKVEFKIKPNDESISEKENVKVVSMKPVLGKKLEVKDFVNYFRNRYNEMKTILQSNPGLDNLVSINKISSGRNSFSIIGILSSKRVTKNKNILLELEDLTGKIRVLINQNNKEVYEKAQDLTLDSVIGVRGNGNNEIIFASDLFLPEARIPVRKKSPEEEYAIFIGDLHFGSKLFMKDNFLKFINYLNLQSKDDVKISKIKYLFLVGDIVTGVGNYPGQELDLEINNLEDQFLELAEVLKKIPKHIKIIISPGNHDGVRLMEPQPILNEKYAWALHDMENVILTTNPAYINIGSKEEKGFSGFDVLTYHGFSYPYYANEIPSLISKKAMNCPEEIMKYLLDQRHLAPSHASTQYFPDEKDALIIRKVPDIFVSAHTHKLALSYHNNILIISTACWEEMTSYQEKFGNKPDHCKVPLVNLKTRAVKILDFE